MPYVRTSLSPQLSRLKDDGFVALEGKIWLLKKFEAADATPEKDKSAASIANPAKGREAGPGGGT